MCLLWILVLSSIRIHLFFFVFFVCVEKEGESCYNKNKTKKSEKTKKLQEKKKKNRILTFRMLMLHMILSIHMLIPFLSLSTTTKIFFPFLQFYNNFSFLCTCLPRDRQFSIFIRFCRIARTVFCFSWIPMCFCFCGEGVVLWRMQGKNQFKGSSITTTPQKKN